MMTMTTVQAAANKKVAPGKAMVVVAVSLLACCSFTLWERVARSPPVLLGPLSATNGVLAKAERARETKHSGFALRRPRPGSGFRRGDEGRRSLMAAKPRQGEEEEEEEEREAVEEDNEAMEEEHEAMEEGTGGEAEETPEEQNEDEIGRQQETEDHAAHQTTNRETAGGAVDDDAVEAVMSPVVAAAAASAPAVPSAATAVKRVWGESSKCWVFMHLQKSGGSTVKRMLNEKWKNRFYTYDDSAWKKREESTRRLGNELVHGNNWNVMAGGYTAALKRVPAVENSCQFFILFRHPIARIVSAYFYCQVVAQDRSCASNVVRAKDVDLLTFAKHWGNYAVRQMAMNFIPSDDVQAYIRTPQARALHKDVNLHNTAGWFQLKAYLERPLEAAEFGEVAQGQRATQEQIFGGRMYSMLQQAQELIKDGYTVGILEEWDTTLALYDSALGIPDMNWKKRYAKQGNMNVNEKFAQVKAQTLKKAWTDLELKKYMQLDLLLYEHAVDVFHEQARSHGVLH